jgi:hypothetical protein
LASLAHFARCLARRPLAEIAGRGTIAFMGAQYERFHAAMSLYCRFSWLRMKWPAKSWNAFAIAYILVRMGSIAARKSASRKSPSYVAADGVADERLVPAARAWAIMDQGRP